MITTVPVTAPSAGSASATVVISGIGSNVVTLAAGARPG